ncbi:MAG TPA: dTDP-4-dehydrorhamnose reductase [Desulfobacteraceae bacterium]|nr:dTDP-4-dehydrorhamnose reductase [Desulfobacteraceae bacterium]HPJ66191.1 dTDP-4-dehydrorhamnose reductase [Desulfobacteraceae bacterium]HPQ27087.1 dTDP-4-dehydrorhamnose reductase [Desulfobacteraceae bacterium]
MKILILGATGMLGSECRRVFSRNHEVISPDKTELDITSWDGVIDIFQRLLPDIVINCAGFTDLKACEKEDFAVRKINIEGPRNLAQGCARFERKLVHISSDYVFDGRKMFPQPYFEDDIPNPLSAYGKSKKDSEIAVRDNSPNYIIIRTGWLYGINGDNFVKSIVTRAIRKKTKMLRIPDDQFGSPTWAYRVALEAVKLLDVDARGTYHITSEGYCSRYEWAKYILNKLGINASLEPCSLKDVQGAVKKPANCILENRSLKTQGLNTMNEWKKDISLFLKNFGERLIKEAETKDNQERTA